jgi:methenyltetrahydromethanopterin cyclohydrolase
MPCDSITTQTVALAKAQPAILAEALKAAGWQVSVNEPAKVCASNTAGESVTWLAGSGLAITAAPSQTKRVEAAVIQAYSKAAVSWAAARAGWQVASSQGNKLTLTRR